MYARNIIIGAKRGRVNPKPKAVQAVDHPYPIKAQSQEHVQNPRS